VSFFYAGTRLLTRTDSGIRNYADLAGKTVATTAGSSNEKVLLQYATDHALRIQTAPAKDYRESFELVESGRAVALALDDVLLFGLRANARNPAAFQVVGDTLQVEPYGCMVRRDDPEFKALVDRTIARLMKTGEFSRLYARWFQSPIPPAGANLDMPMSAPLKANLQKRDDKPAN
jgi:glutamate/aspartate transport system substrate-binding protein